MFKEVGTFFKFRKYKKKFEFFESMLSAGSKYTKVLKSKMWEASTQKFQIQKL